jgi:hypothetical protein
MLDWGSTLSILCWSVPHWTARVSALALGLLTGCEREAPHPEDCLQMARRWHGLPKAAPTSDPRNWTRRGAEVLEARAATSVEALTLRCISEPFDREFVECVNKGRRLDYCRQRSALTEDPAR